MYDDYSRLLHDRVDTCDNDSLSIVYSSTLSSKKVLSNDKLEDCKIQYVNCYIQNNLVYQLWKIICFAHFLWIWLAISTIWLS